jgi:hypothetical protein
MLALVGIAPTQPARADVTCAVTVPSQPSTSSPANPCWTDVNPYPLGSDGNPITSGSSAVPLPVQSLAFRAWNRGLAAVVPLGGSPYSVWLFNGARWYPDPTFPGVSTCNGGTILWAGKLDYWLIGGKYTNGAAGVCRFDGVNFQWDPIDPPAASLSRVPGGAANFTLYAGVCYAWDNCWFFGAGGIVDHWDGQTLSDVSSGLGGTPWLQGRYTAAAASATADAAGNPFALAVTEASARDEGAPLPPEPDGSPAPQAFSSFGAAFTPLANNPFALSPRLSGPATDLVAVAAGSDDAGWIAGNPAGATPGSPVGSTAAPSPLLPITPTGALAPCADYGLDTFQFTPITQPIGADPESWLWQPQALSVFPGSRVALAGGQYRPAGTAQSEPVLMTAQCGQAPQTLRFRVPGPGGSAPIPADVGGYVTAVAANAVNDAWAATTSAPNQPPHLYRLSDAPVPPDAPAGDDNEARPVVFQIDPTIYVQSPGVIPPPPATVSTVTQQTTVTKRVKAKPAIYDVKADKPVVGRGGRITLTISFKVRSPVTIGLEALRGHKVVSSSGLRHFGRGTGHLALFLDRAHWPNRLKFIIPHSEHAIDVVAVPLELTSTILG